MGMYPAMGSDVLRMRYSLAEAPFPVSWPDGAELVTFDPRMSDQLEVLLSEGYEYGGGQPGSSADWYNGVSSDEEFDPALVLVAWDTGSGHVAGVCHVWTSAFVKDLAVRPAWRRRGLGTALLRSAMCVMAERGHRHLDLKVEAGNPHRAPKLYASLGFGVIRE